MTVELSLPISQRLNSGDPSNSEESRSFQGVLPQFRAVMRGGNESQFAHPAEVELARVFSFFGLRWAYEPTTFALPPQPGGESGGWFTPDFYLPDQRLYIELTTMRQRLVTRKNRKVRQLLEAYPNVRIKLVYRRDYLRLMSCYRGALAQAAPDDIVRVLWSAEEIDERIAELAVALDQSLGAAATSPVPTLLALGDGPHRFQSLLRRHLERLGYAPEIQRIGLVRQLSVSRRARVRPRQQLQLADFTGRPVVLLTDVVSTGLSLTYVRRWLQRRGVERLVTCTLLDRPSARLIDPGVVIAGFEAPNDVLVGFGLQLRPDLSNLPYIGVLRTNAVLDGFAPPWL